MGTFRRRIEQSKPFDLVINWLGRLLASYFKFCRATSSIQFVAIEEVAASIQDGPVLLVVWHGRMASVLMSWTDEFGECVSISDPSPIGRLGAAAQRSFGLSPISIPRSAAKVSARKEVLKALRFGKCIALTADGPKGPCRQANVAVAAWIKKSEAPVFLSSWSLRAAFTLPTWDRFLFPLPFSRGVIIYRRFELKEKISDLSQDELRSKLTAALNELDSEADQLRKL